MTGGCRGVVPLRLTVEAEAEAVEGAEPEVAAALAAVGAGDRGAGGLDDGRAQRLRREGQWLAVDQGKPHSFGIMVLGLVEQHLGGEAGRADAEPRVPGRIGDASGVRHAEERAEAAARV